MDLSLEDLRCAIADELMETYGADAYGTCLYYIVETFTDYVITRGPGSALYRFDYTVAGADESEPGEIEINLGDPQLVEVVYAPVSQSARFLTLEANAAGDGWSFPAQVMEAGWASGTVEGANGMPHYFPPDVVRQVAEAMQGGGVKFGRHHPASGMGSDDPSRIAGWVDGGRMAGNSAVGVVHILKSETDLQSRIAAAMEAKRPDLFGLSILGYFAFKAGNVEGKQALVATKLGKLMSVDMVGEAGAGGKFLQVAASLSMLSEISRLQKDSVVQTGNNDGTADAGRSKGAIVKQKILRVLEALRVHNATRATELETEFATVKESGYADFMVKVTEAALAETGTNSATQTLVTEARAALDETKKIQSRNLVETKLAASKLPAPALTLVRQHLADRVVTGEEIDAEVTKVREAFAAYATTGKVNGSRTEVGLDSNDKVQKAFDAMLGVKEAMTDPDARGLHSVKQAYILATGDTNLQFGIGGIGGFMRISEATSLTTDFPNLLLNSMTKKLMQDYAEVSADGLDPLYYPSDLADFKSQDRVRMGYLGDLSTVAEDGNYTDFAKPTDERFSFTPTKRGNTLPVSRETILNDDLQAIARYPMRVARAGRRTLKQFITNFFVNNSTYGADTLAWFHATHNNLSTNPLSITELQAREIALFNQTEKDSGKPLGLVLNWLMIPINLKVVAYQINQAQFYNPGPGIQLPNPFYQRFGANNERILVNELLSASDANDWYYGSPQMDAPFLEIGFVQGVRQPQMFLQNDPQQGAVFTNDRITYKVRHEYGGGIADFRSVGKSVVP